MTRNPFLVREHAGPTAGEMHLRGEDHDNAVVINNLKQQIEHNYRALKESEMEIGKFIQLQQVIQEDFARRDTLEEHLKQENQKISEQCRFIQEENASLRQQISRPKNSTRIPTPEQILNNMISSPRSPTTAPSTPKTMQSPDQRFTPRSPFTAQSTVKKDIKHETDESSKAGINKQPTQQSPRNPTSDTAKGLFDNLQQYMKTHSTQLTDSQKASMEPKKTPHQLSVNPSGGPPTPPPPPPGGGPPLPPPPPAGGGPPPPPPLPPKAANGQPSSSTTLIFKDNVLDVQQQKTYLSNLKTAILNLKQQKSRKKSVKKENETRKEIETPMDFSQIKEQFADKRQIGSILFKPLLQLLSMLIVKCVYDNNKLNDEDTMDKTAKFISGKIKLLGDDFDTYCTLSFPNMKHIVGKDTMLHKGVYDQQKEFFNLFKTQNVFTDLEIKQQIDLLFESLKSVPEFLESDSNIDFFLKTMTKQYVSTKAETSLTVETFIKNKNLRLLNLTQEQMTFLEQIELYPNELFNIILSVSKIKSSIYEFSETIDIQFSSDIKVVFTELKSRISIVQKKKDATSKNMTDTEDEFKKFDIDFKFEESNFEFFKILKFQLCTACLKKYEHNCAYVLNGDKSDNVEDIQFLNENLPDVIIFIINSCENFINGDLHKYLEKCKLYYQKVYDLNAKNNIDASGKTNANMSFNFNRAPFASAIPTVFRICSFKV